MKRVPQDLTGRRFGKWLVLGASHCQRYGREIKRYWFCVCDCGNSRVQDGHLLLFKRSTQCKSCARSTHGNTRGRKGTREFRTWTGMKQRCTNPLHIAWKNYGGRGISICERWMKFENFLADMGKRPKGTTLSRIDNNGNYEPSNCGWATPLEQVENRRCTRFLKLGEETMTLAKWSKKTGIPKSTIFGRLDRGWSIERALST